MSQIADILAALAGRRPTFGLEQGGSYDRSVGVTALKNHYNHIPEGSGTLPYEKRRRQAQQAEDISDLFRQGER